MKALFKKSLAVLLSVLLLFTAVPFTASTATLDEAEQSVGASNGTTGDCTWTLDDYGTLTISGNGAMGDYSERYSDDIWFTTAPWGASIKSVVIEDGVTSIGEYAFYGCADLISATIPDSVTNIGSNAFEYCTGLTSVTIPDSVTSIGNRAFSICDNLTSITVDSGNHVYDSRNNCNAIIETATNTVKFGCKKTVIPYGVTSIGHSAFSSCTDLTNITIPDSVTRIDVWAFFNCTGLTSVTIPDSVTRIDIFAFYHCSGLTSVTIGNGVTSIGGSAFFHCTSLRSVTIGNRVKSIGGSAFSG